MRHFLVVIIALLLFSTRSHGDRPPVHLSPLTNDFFTPLRRLRRGLRVYQEHTKPFKRDNKYDLYFPFAISREWLLEIIERSGLPIPGHYSKLFSGETALGRSLQPFKTVEWATMSIPKQEDAWIKKSGSDMTKFANNLEDRVRASFGLSKPDIERRNTFVAWSYDATPNYYGLPLIWIEQDKFFWGAISRRSSYFLSLGMDPAYDLVLDFDYFHFAGRYINEIFKATHIFYNRPVPFAFEEKLFRNLNFEIPYLECRLGRTYESRIILPPVGSYGGLERYAFSDEDRTYADAFNRVRYEYFSQENPSEAERSPISPYLRQALGSASNHFIPTNPDSVDAAVWLPLLEQFRYNDLRKIERKPHVFWELRHMGERLALPQ